MKVRLTIDLELPDELSGFSKPELDQLLFDAYINYITCAHYEDALNRIERGHINDTAESIVDYHKQWGRTSKPVNWSYERLTE